jgi:hypothetical protein
MYNLTLEPSFEVFLRGVSEKIEEIDSSRRNRVFTSLHTLRFNCIYYETDLRYAPLYSVIMWFLSRLCLENLP